MREEGGMRKRGSAAGGGVSSMYADNSLDDEEEKPLVGGPPLSESKDEGAKAPTLSSSSGAVSTTKFKIGLVIEKIREIDMSDMYRYWSVVQPELTQEQLEKLDRWCEENVAVPCTSEDHSDLLFQLWDLSFPDSDVKPEFKDPQWKRLGFQGNDPFTDFRAAGKLSLQVLVHFADTYADKYKESMKRSMGNGSVESSYPFACAAINVVFMLTDIMKLKRAGSGEARSNEPDAVLMRATFARMLETNDKAFLDLSCVCMMFLDNEWVRTKATYMMFPTVLKTTRERSAAALRSAATKNPAAAAKYLGVDLYAGA